MGVLITSPARVESDVWGFVFLVFQSYFPVLGKVAQSRAKLRDLQSKHCDVEATGDVTARAKPRNCTRISVWM